MAWPRNMQAALYHSRKRRLDRIAAAQGGGGGPLTGAYFNGSTYMKDATGSGRTQGKLMTLGVSFTVDDQTDSVVVVGYGPNDMSLMMVNTDLWLRVEATDFSLAKEARWVGAIETDVVYQCLVSINGTDCDAYLNEVVQAPSANLDKVLKTNGLEQGVGVWQGAESIPMLGNIHWYYLNIGVDLDFSNAANRADFLSKVPSSVDGTDIHATAPNILLNNRGTDFFKNTGTDADFTVTGTLQDPTIERY